MKIKMIRGKWVASYGNIRVFGDSYQNVLSQMLILIFKEKMK